MLINHGDIETNQDQKVKALNSFHAATGILTVFLHLINILASLLTVYNSIQNYDIICISETYLDSSSIAETEAVTKRFSVKKVLLEISQISQESTCVRVSFLIKLQVNTFSYRIPLLDASAENTLKLYGCSLIRADHPNSMRRDGVCLYYKENLLLRHLKTEYFPQGLLRKISVQNQTCYLVVTYRPLDQNNNAFNEFLSNFERLLNHVKQLKSYFLVILGDFNARSQSWCLDDMNSNDQFE